MKKLVAALAAGVIVAGSAATSVSAETHEVEKGDSLWNIAEEYNTTVNELVEINELNTTTIQPKQLIVIDNEKYVVEQGDTLSAISSEFDITVDNLKTWNDLKSDIIVVGQELDVNGANPVQAEDSSTEVAKEPKQEVKQEPKKEAKQEVKQEPKQEEAQASAPKEKESTSNEEPSGKTISVSATAYTGQCDGCSGVTSTGVDLNADPNAKVIAVDPNVIPLGTKVHVEGYGYATAADIGSAIKGNKIDVHVPTKDQAYDWGVRTVNVTIVD